MLIITDEYAIYCLMSFSIILMSSVLSPGTRPVNYISLSSLPAEFLILHSLCHWNGLTSDLEDGNEVEAILSSLELVVAVWASGNVTFCSNHISLAIPHFRTTETRGLVLSCHFLTPHGRSKFLIFLDHTTKVPSDFHSCSTSKVLVNT